jgi:diguanylate cyclase (GGDEF)-like protein
VSTETAPTAAPSRRLSFVAGLSLLYALLAVILIILGTRVWQSTYEAAADNDWVSHTYKVEGQINGVLARLGTMQTDAIGYAMSGDRARLTRFNTQTPLIDNDLETLSRLVADNPTEHERAAELAKAIQQQRDQAAQMIAGRDSAGHAPADIGDFGFSSVRSLARVMLDEEEKLLHERRMTVERTELLTRVLTAIALGVCFVFLILTYWLVRASHARNARTRENLRATNVKLFEALENANTVTDSMTKLSQLGEMLQSCRTLDEMRGGIGGVLTDLLPGLGGRLALISPSQNLAAVGAHWGRHGLIAESVFAPEDCWALRRGQPYPLAGANTGFVCKHVDYPNPENPHAGYLCVPLSAQGEVIGVLTFDGERAPNANERRIALAAGEQLALALANLRLQETLRTQSVRDPLTSLFNRRYLEVSLERELLRASRRALPLAVLMLDIDHFKRFNDSYGHDAGDALLAQFADVLKRTVRSEDIACRYGGEEFTIVLLEADATAAAQRAEAIRAAVAEMSVVHHQQQLPRVTVSIGLSLYPHDARSPEDLLRRADAALYAAKKAGRDRVFRAEQLASAAPAQR